MEKAEKRIPGCIFLLRKSEGDNLPVLKKDDFPAPFVFNGRRYEIRVTKSGGLIMV